VRPGEALAFTARDLYAGAAVPPPRTR
jgi:hypothetical protein